MNPEFLLHTPPLHLLKKIGNCLAMKYGLKNFYDLSLIIETMKEKGVNDEFHPIWFVSFFGTTEDFYDLCEHEGVNTTLIEVKRKLFEKYVGNPPRNCLELLRGENDRKSFLKPKGKTSIKEHLIVSLLELPFEILFNLGSFL